jgi:hypothetical protein
MRPVTRTFIAILVLALCATHAVFARTHHRGPKRTSTAVETKTGVAIPAEQNRDPEDIALDHKIRGICRGC